MNNDKSKDQIRDEMRSNLNSSATPREIVSWFGNLEEFSKHLRKRRVSASDEDIAVFWDELKSSY